MIIRRLDSAGDWTFGKGLSNYAQNEEAINENIRTRLLSWVGDCFFALQEGVDWKSRLDAGQQQALLNEIKSVVVRSFGVVGINSVSFNFNGRSRAYTLVYDIQTIFSPSFQNTITVASGA